MWLSKRIMLPETAEDPATLGTVSIGGNAAAVVTDGEKRNAKVISPGGYCWQPSTGQSVLIVKANEAYVPGVLQDGGDLLPGEILIHSDSAQIRLQNDGNIRILGEVWITGKLYVNGKEIR